MKKTNLLLQQCLAEASATRVKINNSQYKNTSGFLLSCDGVRSKIFIENSDYKIITVPSSIVRIAEFDNRQLSLEHLLPALIAVASSENYHSRDINSIFECGNLKNLNIFLNKKGIKNNNINSIRNTILNEEIISATIIHNLILMLLGEVIYEIASKDSNLDNIIHDVIQSFPETTEYLNGLSKYGPIAVHIGSIWFAARMVKQVAVRVLTKTASMENFKEDFKKMKMVRDRMLNWLEKLKNPITEEEATNYFKDPEKYFTVNTGNVNFLQKINNIGNSLYANDATKDIFYFDENTQNLYITNRYHSKKHIKLAKAEHIISNNANSIIGTSIFALAPSGIIPRVLNRIRDWAAQRNTQSRRLPPPLPPGVPPRGDLPQIGTSSPIDDILSAEDPDDII